jgi:hypothetical protein
MTDLDKTADEEAYSGLPDIMISSRCLRLSSDTALFTGTASEIGSTSILHECKRRWERSGSRLREN